MYVLFLDVVAEHPWAVEAEPYNSGEFGEIAMSRPHTVGCAVSDDFLQVEMVSMR